MQKIYDIFFNYYLEMKIYELEQKGEHDEDNRYTPHYRHCGRS